ncbi:hypothetical protein [Bacillus sp. ISL-39]|uniref:hypothetical protein n=1 Tax=Bacillus sp. ISL-39 TaxID=2819124 RepID=UPI001BE6CB27|nr:hypothetical protein [Bacillus sp. ISL-39]MBT2639430.1 hypothetical protein [Bacillus sp. ISL-39]
MNTENEHSTVNNHDHSQTSSMTKDSSQSSRTPHDSHEHHQENSMMDSHQGHTDHKENIAKVRVDWTSNPHTVKVDQETEIFIDIKDFSGKVIETFQAVHEKEMHLLAIKKDLSVFQHLHPHYRGKGRFQVETTFPKAGEYKFYADFLPEGANQQLASHELVVNGSETMEEVVPDKLLKKEMDDLTIELILPEAKVDEHISLIFTLNDKNGNPITELEPYLGSAGHVVIVSEDMNEFLHVHPVDEDTKGPDVEYMTSFPQSGLYKIWGQFKYKHKLYTVPFVIEVK